MSRESFYVGISRAKESVQVFTDDAELLARRVEDTHTRKAALELQGLRDELAKHGLTQAKEAERKKATLKPTVDGERLFRVSRAMRFMRGQPLNSVLVVQKWAGDFKAWVGQKIAMGAVERPTQRVSPANRITAVNHVQQRPDEPRATRGYRI